jgi:uncharacterized protein DUF5677
VTKRWWMCDKCQRLRHLEEIRTCNRTKSCPLAHIPKNAPKVKMDLATLSEKITKATDGFQREATEARRIVGQRQQETLKFCARLLAVLRVVLDEKKASLPNRGWRVIVVSLAAKVMSTVRASLTLAEAAHGHEVDIPVRSALEALITALFIAQKQSKRRAKRWAQYADFLRARLLKKYPDLSKTPEHLKARPGILRRGGRLKRLFPNPGFWASGLHKGGLRDLAEDVGMGWYYDMPYWSGSQSTHGSAIAVDRHLDIDAHGTPRYNIGLSGRRLRGELAVCCDLLVRTLGLLNDVCKLELQQVMDELVPEYKAVFGGDSVEKIFDDDD